MSAIASRLRATILWSVIAAAFIGPGTVTTAASAGAGFGLGLLWALLFSVIATIVLQEAAARLTIASGLNLGQLVARRTRHGGRGYRWLLFASIFLGCAAYQAGNLLGAISGLQLIFRLHPSWILLPAVAAVLLLWTGNYRTISRLLAAIVGIMGLTFIWVAFGADATGGEWLAGLAPRIDDASALLVIGLIGTTIVPYNLFLATGLARGQTVEDMRWGQALSIGFGGAITLAILLSGTLLAGEFSFPALAHAVGERVGAAGPLLFGIGLFAAGFSSAITAPWAAAVTGQTLLEAGESRWAPRGVFFRLTWLLVLLIGLTFGLLDFRPIPVIIAAQAVNGLILPLVAVFLLLAVNDRQLLGERYTNTPLLNILSLCIVGVAIFLGLHNIWLAAGKVWPELLIRFDLGLRALIDGIIAALGLLLLATRLQWQKKAVAAPRESATG